jgi:uncharacterized delta-60 repeat protein
MSNGDLDYTFLANINSAPTNKGFNNSVKTLALTYNGTGENTTDYKIYAGGKFTNFNNTPANRIVRLNYNGTRDNSFNIGSGFLFGASQAEVNSICVQVDKKILVGGKFSTYNVTTVSHLVRLKTDGSLDTAFMTNIGTGIPAGGHINVIKENGGYIYIGGMFQTFDGITVNSIVRLNALGQIDNIFTDGFLRPAPVITTIGEVLDIDFLSDGSILVSGLFDDYNGTPIKNFVKLDANGTYVDHVEFNDYVRKINAKNDNIILGGDFTSMLTSGSGDSDLYNIPIGQEITRSFGLGFDDSLTPTAIDFRDNKFLVVGDFGFFNGYSVQKVVKINADGTYDFTFDTSSGAVSTGALYSCALRADGSAFISGAITSYAGNSVTGLACINADGTFNSSFNTGTGFAGIANAGATKIIVDDATDGALFLGAFLSYNGVTVNGIVKLASDGSIDTSFDMGAGFDVPPTDAIKVDGGYIVIGDFTSYDGYMTPGIVKIKDDGTRDTTFNVGSGTSNSMRGIKLQSDGKIVCVLAQSNGMPSPSLYNGIPFTGAMFRINTDGSFDTSFNSSQYLTNNMYLIPNGLLEIDNEDRIYVYDNLINNTIVRYTKDGVYDASFSVTSLTPTGTFPFYFIKLYFNTLIIGGNFTSSSSSINIESLDLDGNVSSTVDNYQTILNTYDNCMTFHNLYGIKHSIVGNKVRVIYEFDSDEVVVTDIFDTPDYVEITYINESLSIKDLIKEVVVRSPLLIKSDNLIYDSVNYDIRIFEGSLFSGLTYPILYQINKQKLFTGQNNVYINVNNYVKENLEANVNSFLNTNILDCANLPANMSKWVRVDETLLLTGTTADTKTTYMFATDGYLYNFEDQYIPNILHSGDKRYMHYDQQQQIYFQTNFLTGITVTNSNGNTVQIPVTVDLEALNIKYINSINISTTDLSYYSGPRPTEFVPLTWAEYTFNYSNSSQQSIRYEFYGDCLYDNYTLVFKNKWGVLESIPMSRKSVITINTQGKDLNRSILDYNGNYDITRHTNKKYNLDGYDSWVLNTNWVPEYMKDAFQELMLSEEVWLIDNDSQIIPIIKEDESLTYKTRLNDKLIQYSLKVKMSHSKIKNIL